MRDEIAPYDELSEGDVIELQVELHALQAKVKAVRTAIDNEGPFPAYHQRVMKRHRKEWPTLWNALDALLGGDG